MGRIVRAGNDGIVLTPALTPYAKRALERGIVIRNPLRGLGMKVNVHAVSFDAKGRIIGESWAHNTIEPTARDAILQGWNDPTSIIRCGRKLQILDTVLGWNSSFETASLKSGSGTGSVNYYTKVYTFPHPGGGTTYTINQAKLADGGSTVWGVVTIAPAATLAPGGSVLLEYTVTYTDHHDGTWLGTLNNAWIYELARAQGKDADTEILSLGHLDGGTIRLTFTQGGVTQPTISKTCYYSGGVDPFTTSYGSNIYLATAFTDGTSAAATPTKIELISTGGTVYGEQTASLGGPFDFTAGSISIQIECGVI